MRLTEELIELLKGLETGAAIVAPPDVLEEAAHEGLIANHEHGEIQLTNLGREQLKTINAQLFSADQLQVQEQARIAYISQRNYARFQKLLSFGLSVGVPIKLQQRFPSFVVECEETQIALEEEIARDIFVWRQA